MSSPKIEETNEVDLDISDSIKNGILFIEDESEKVALNNANVS